MKEILNHPIATLLCCLLSSVPILSQAQMIDTKAIPEIVVSNLKFIASEQIQNQSAIYEAGEWPTRIESTLLPAALGVGRLIGENEEATPFTTGSVVNALAILFLDHPELQSTPDFQKIPKLISKAIPTFERYKEGPLFNFYPARDWKGTRVHQPADMKLIGAWKGLTNIPEDADTSSIVYSALIFNSMLAGQKYEIPQAALDSLQTFRDSDRKAHYYNRGEKRTQTGAFMTWQFNEKDPEMPRFWFAGPEKGTRIPFNRNDVDCIVNLNVLRMLALNKTSSVEGRDQACNMINDMIRKNEHATCGIYYPNTFNLAYSVAMASKAGETCLETDPKRQTVEFILKLQSEDGGWDNDRNIWKDRIQSTIFAMTALLEFGDLKDRRIESSLRFAASFLVKNSHKSAQGYIYWKGETFFTATAAARAMVIWKSNSYTTALAANALLKFAEAYK